MIAKVFGLGLIGLSVGMFWAIFFKLAPYIVSLLPQNDWSSILGVIIYVVVGYFGGVAIPLFVFGAGMYVFVKSL